jgi:hypothetical protein
MSTKSPNDGGLQAARHIDRIEVNLVPQDRSTLSHCWIGKGRVLWPRALLLFNNRRSTMFQWLTKPTAAVHRRYLRLDLMEELVWRVWTKNAPRRTGGGMNRKPGH